MINQQQARRAISPKNILYWLTLALVLICVQARAQTGGTVTYVYTDPQGTPLAETDANGNITATFEYTPYGTYAPQGTSTPGPAPKGPGYTGHVNDPETNLVYMQARYYDPVTGHFLSTDPVGPRAGDAFNFNRYAYVNNNPIMGLDPTGMEDECGSGCMMMRRLSDYFSGIGRAILGGSSGMTSTQGPLGRAQSAITYMNGAANEDLASASATVAPLADAVPGMTLVGCVDAGHCSAGDVILGGLAVLPGEGIEAEAATAFGREIRLVSGFYEAEGSAFKFSKYYYNHLWSTGRGAPFLVAEDVLNTAKTVAPDRKAGFNRYANDAFEMIYNPTTKEVWHLQPTGK